MWWVQEIKKLTHYHFKYILHFFLIKSKEKEENINFGKNIAKHADIAIIVNQTNKDSIKQGLLEEGFAEEKIHFAQNLVEARIILKEIAEEGDVVLFENDLPDNYQ